MTTSMGTLLVVDDEEFNRDMLGRRLEIEDYTVVLASSGPEALRLIGEHDFDAVLLDVMMPGQNGYEVLAEIRKTRSVSDLPVLMVTAKSQSEDVVNAFDVGASDYVTKPINFPVTLARIKLHVGSRRLAAQLKQSEARYALSAQGANDGLWDWDLVGGRVYYSARWKEMLGYAEAEVGDLPEEWFGRVHPDDLPHLRAAIEAHRAGLTDRFESEHRMLNKDGTHTWVLTRGVATRDAAGSQVRMAGSQTDITRGKAADPLTGLANRTMLLDHLGSAAPAAGSVYAVMFIDVDRFKLINDSLGHQAGDELLKAIAQRLEACIRASDVVTRPKERCTVARLGGDEFVVLLKGLARPEDATIVADRILRSVSEPVTIQGHPVSVTCSVGIAVGRGTGETAEGILQDADTAMYQAKSEGKSRWRLFAPEMREDAVRRLGIENDLRRGVRDGEFRVVYQPIVSIGSERTVGFEALLRWQHPERGLVSPAEFIPVAEETGLIVELGHWILGEACSQLGDWQRRHPAHPPLFVSVNVSCRQFGDTRLVEHLRQSIERGGIRPECLKLEITESAIMSDPRQAALILHQIRALGVQISLDDFGTGHSSLSYLQQFPIDTLKIDRSFVQKLSGSRESQEIVRTIIKLAHTLGMRVTAEGVEERVQHSRLMEFACETGQGYLYSRPVSAETIDACMEEFGRITPGGPAGEVAGVSEVEPAAGGR